MLKQKHSRRQKAQKGNTVVEFALVSTFLVPLLLGTFVVGMNLTRSIQATQITRDAGHMYAMGIDFSQNANKDVLVRLAIGMNMTRTGGTGVIILSKIMKVYQSDCDAASLTSVQCTNLNQNVVTNRLVIGNSATRASDFGTPNASLIDSQGNVSNYLRDTSARANNFSSVLALNAGEIAFLSEAYFASLDLDFQSYQTGTGIYARSIF